MSLLAGPPPPGSGPIRCTVPAAKSYVLRATLLAALRGRGRILREGPDGGDVRALVAGLRTLGAEIETTSEALEVRRGIRRTPGDPIVLRVEDGGAPARFLAAAAALGERTVHLETGARLARRPFGPLFEALRTLGAEVSAPGNAPPAVIRGPLRGGGIEAALGESSSQFLSALLLAAPALGEPLEIVCSGPLRSPGYVDLTLGLLRAFGVRVRSAPGWWLVEPGFASKADPPPAPADWSSAAPLLAAAAFLRRPVVVRGLRLDDGQPDAAFADHLRALGLDVRAAEDGVEASGRPLQGGSFDVARCPDLAPTLAALGAVCPGGITLHGAPHLKAKESDRIASAVALLRAAGISAEPRADGLRVAGDWASQEPASAPFTAPASSDHRLIQAASLLALRRPALIPDEAHVEKSFPGFFAVFPGAFTEVVA
jgi:3-phosphoshikimate 1-carboxyvinyltransferase